jgi:hypothetical protein
VILPDFKSSRGEGATLPTKGGAAKQLPAMRRAAESHGDLVLASRSREAAVADFEC